MYELNNKVRLIDTSEFGLSSSDGFIGFICGIISQDHDLEQMYLDSFLKIAKLEDADITETIDKLDELGEKYNITFVLSISLDADDLPENEYISELLHADLPQNFLWGTSTKPADSLRLSCSSVNTDVQRSFQYIP